MTEGTHQAGMDTRTVNGLTVAFVDRGAGLPVLLVHGFPLDHIMWNHQIDALSSSYRVIAPDLCGFGQSEATEGTITMERFADDLAELLDALGITEPFVFCGLSMGGYIAFAFCRKYASRLAGLILCDTRATADTPEAAKARRQMADQVHMCGVKPLVDMMFPKLFAPATFEEQPEVVDRIRRIMLGSNPRAVAAAHRGMAERRDATPELGQISCPTLVVVGQHDALTPPADMRAMAANIPGAHLVEIAGAGHLAPVEKPAEVNAAIVALLTALGRATGS